MTKEIPLTRGKFVIVDEDAYDYLMQWKWHYDGYYAVRTEVIGRKNKRSVEKKIWMHRVINQTPQGMDTDHINCNKLDNRRENLRSCTRSQNAMNCKGRPSSSMFRGVKRHKKNQCWVASISIKGTRTHLGSFKNEADAATAYNFAALEHHGAFARLNRA